jgi:glycosyltransferase involved in cell wall biosynthesis
MPDLGLPKITFGIIVLNGEPFTRYCLRSLYPFAHEIIVVEGGHEDAKTVCTPDGHSIDGTLETLRRFIQEEDPENKVQIVTRDGFWTKRDELGRARTHQSRAYAERATGDYLWQVDIDEFYHPDDMRRVIEMIHNDPEISVVSFWVHTFWGGLGYEVDGWKRRRGDEFFRLFKWGEGYRYITHEPPTVQDDKGVDLRSYKWISGSEMEQRGVNMFHYAHLFPRQILQKAQIYNREKSELYPEIFSWVRNNYNQLGNPYRVERHYWFPSWIVRFNKSHPPEAQKMMDDILLGKIKEDLRKSDDIERLLKSKGYSLGRHMYRVLDYVDRAYQWITQFIYPQSKHICRLVIEPVMPRLYRKYYRTTQRTFLDKIVFEHIKRFS